jgi:hypothetical protein
VICHGRVFLEHRGVRLQHLLSFAADVGAVELEEQRRKGESRFRSSSDFDPIVSSAGIGGTGSVRSPAAAARRRNRRGRSGSDIGGGIGRATGGLALPLHAATTTVSSRTRTSSALACRLITTSEPEPWNLEPWNPDLLLRPVRRLVVAVLRDLPDVLPVTVDREDLALPARVDMNARWRPFGDHAGLSLVPSPNVICRVSPVPMFRILMSKPGPLRAEKAISLYGAGDHVGRSAYDSCEILLSPAPSTPTT